MQVANSLVLHCEFCNDYTFPFRYGRGDHDSDLASRYHKLQPTGPNILDDAAMSQDAEETGWKLVHGDVFRPPKMAGLAVYVGSGAQLFGMSFV